MSMIVRQPSYYADFCCIASACPDSCCKEWEIEVDADSARRYRAMPGPLGDRLRAVLRDEDGAVVLQNERGRCPMWRADGLCCIQAELGEEALCHTCREFPRLRHEYGDFAELGLELACPEAAKLILSPHGGFVCLEQSGEASGEYDREAMGILLSSREELRGILHDESYSISQRLALALMYAYHVQALLDDEDMGAFDKAASLEQAESFAAEGSEAAVLAFFSRLEILSTDWKARLEAPLYGEWEPRHILLAEYFMDRYWLQAASDGDIVCRVKLMIVSCLAVKLLGGELVSTAQRFSKEVENNIDNVEAVLDAAYTCPAFTDDKLLGYLLD